MARPSLRKPALFRPFESPTSENSDPLEERGISFDQSLGSPEGHFGLRIMEDTIGEAGGTLQVMSAPGHGTTVIARFGAESDAVLRGVPQPVP
jgi:two-component system NarL family sensor kinase